MIFKTFAFSKLHWIHPIGSFIYILQADPLKQWYNVVSDERKKKDKERLN
jgi:hypothetical protein